MRLKLYVFIGNGCRLNSQRDQFFEKAKRVRRNDSRKSYIRASSVITNIKLGANNVNIQVLVKNVVKVSALSLAFCVIFYQ